MLNWQEVIEKLGALQGVQEQRESIYFCPYMRQLRVHMADGLLIGLRLGASIGGQQAFETPFLTVQVLQLPAIMIALRHINARQSLQVGGYEYDHYYQDNQEQNNGSQKGLPTHANRRDYPLII